VESVFVLQSEICSDDTLRIDIIDSSERAAVARYLRSLDSWIECVEGMNNVIVQFDSSDLTHDAAKSRLNEQLLSVPTHDTAALPSIEVPVCYGGEFGPELESICEMLALTQDELIAMHTSRQHIVELIGFTPGFAYVAGLSDDLNVPRLTEPRQRVEPGSVGIAGGLTGLYALAGPGGWPLIGRTPVALFRPDQAQPLMLSGGTRIRFVAIDEKAFQKMVMR
jgi:KipI family sensor histidine kinase inhibitor